MIDDFHTHLRQGKLMETVTPLLQMSGVETALVMPNLTPPIATTQQAIEYHSKLQKLAPRVKFLMTLYLTPDLTPEEVMKAKESGIVVGVKSYPRGVTTNSESGIENYESYYSVFAAMEKAGLVLNLHGEIPSDVENQICVLNAEEAFLVHLEKLHQAFPSLKIVLEHATTRKAVEMVSRLGKSVGCTITIHHLELTVDDWAGCCHNYCKPVAKFPDDRNALREAVLSGNPKFFLGTDSAPHPRHLKEGPKSAAGVFTGQLVLPYLAHALDSFDAFDQLESFARINGRLFYGLDTQTNLVDGKNRSLLHVTRKEMQIPREIQYVDDHGIVRYLVPYKSGKTINFSIDSTV